jgi:hypothetical protein
MLGARLRMPQIRGLPSFMTAIREKWLWISWKSMFTVTGNDTERTARLHTGARLASVATETVQVSEEHHVVVHPVTVQHTDNTLVLARLELYRLPRNCNVKAGGCDRRGSLLRKGRFAW